MLKNITDF